MDQDRRGIPSGLKMQGFVEGRNFRLAVASEFLAERNEDSICRATATVAGTNLFGSVGELQIASGGCVGTGENQNESLNRIRVLVGRQNSIVQFATKCEEGLCRCYTRGEELATFTSVSGIFGGSPDKSSGLLGAVSRKETGVENDCELQIDFIHTSRLHEPHG